MSAAVPAGPLAAARPLPSPRPVGRAGLAVSLAVWGLVSAYIIVFCALSLRRYDAFLMHALDMGNMEQAVWNTVHGHPFRFTNMRAHLPIEAFGTETRLSFHVEPILLPLSLVALTNLGPPALLVIQTVVVASGALALLRLVRLHLPESPLAQVVFPLVYLLFPALQAANLYEFHPVTLTAALLLWAITFAEERRLAAFAAVAVAALACKEEIGIVVALLALWSLRRGMPRRFALVLAGSAAAWSLLAVLIIVPAAQRSQHSTVAASPYLTRYLAPGQWGAGHYRHATPGDVLGYWVTHPREVATLTLGPPKQGFLQRLLAPTGYLALLAPATLLVSVPSLLLILLSVAPQMYSGLGHYAAEFVGIISAAAVLGLLRVAAFAERRGLPRRWGLRAGTLCVLVLGLANARVNGFSPAGAAFEWPALTPHVRVGQRMLALIPPAAAVSAQDTLDPHLSDRAAIYLFPDYKDAAYIALDVSASAIPADPRSLHATVTRLLASRRWDLLFADDGYLLLRRRARPAAVAPHLPAAFYTFVLVQSPAIEHPLRVAAGDGMEMRGYTISRREVVNLRVPDVVLTTYWRVLHRPPGPLAMTIYLTNVRGQLQDVFPQQAALVWYPSRRWRPGQMLAVSSTSMTIGATDPGAVSACVAVHDATAPIVYDPARLSTLPGRLPLVIRAAGAASGPHALVAGGRVLCLASLPVVF